LLFILTVIVLCRVDLVSAHPDFDVHPRTIENALPGNSVKQDTLRIDNVGNEELTWELEVEADVADWLTASPLEGRVGAGGFGLVIVHQDGRELDPGHYYGNFHFTSNDQTKPFYDVPVAGHTTTFPRIEATWAIPQQGEWWGLDMDKIIQGPIELGQTYSFALNIRNRGTASLDCDTILCNNAYFTFSPGNFDLDPGGSRNVTVTFQAREIGGNSGAISSQSNAWDPRELNFRITGTVVPVFRMGSRIPDTTIFEDDAELLVADLDTVFYASDGNTEMTITPSAGLLTRLARNNELFIHSRANWFGSASVVLQARLGDSLLVDTFAVQVTPTPDAPAPFDLISPSDAETLYYDGGDSLFVWQATTDPDLDTVYYQLEVIQHGTVDSLILLTSFILPNSWNLSEIYLNPELYGEFTWTVWAKGGGSLQPAWSTFTFFMTQDRLAVKPEFKPPVAQELVSIFPTPFNGKLSVILRPTTSGLCKVELIGMDGRTLGLYLNEELTAGVYRYDLDLSDYASGSYLMRLQVDGASISRLVNFVR